MLPNVSLKQVFKVNWVTRFGTKYRKSDLIIFDIYESLPIFGFIQKLWVVHEYIYIEVKIATVTEFDKSYQSYILEHEERELEAFTTFDNLVDFNVYEVKSENGNQYVPCLLYTSPSPRDRG